MIEDKKIPKTEESLHWLVEKALTLREGQFLEALYYKKLKPVEAQQMLNEAIIWHARVNQEVLRLNGFAQDFNQKFATDDNKCFETAEKLFNRIRSGIGGAKKIYCKFSPRVRREYYRRHPDKHVPSVFERSYLSSACSEQLFGLDTYGDTVYHLYVELSQAIRELAIGLLLCRNILREEKMIRESPQRLQQVYDDCISEAIEGQKLFIRYIESQGAEHTVNSPISDRIHSHTSEDERLQVIRELYHNCNTEDFANHAVVERILSGRKQGLEGLEPLLWPGRKEKALEVRFLIEHFDELEPKGRQNTKKGGKEYKLDATKVALLLEWSQVAPGQDKVFVEQHFGKLYQGKYDTVGYTAVHSAKTKMLRPSKKEAEERKNFFQEIVSLLAKNGRNPITFSITA